MGRKMNVKYENDAKRVTKFFSSDNLEPVICISPQIDRQGEHLSVQLHFCRKHWYVGREAFILQNSCFIEN